MAETTKKRTTFKKGDISFLSDDYNNLDSEQRAHFRRMAQEQGGFDEAGLAALDEILNGYVKDVSSGTGFNSDGGRDTDKVVNMEMETRKPGLFKKKVYTKQDIAAWGKYYFNKLVSNLKEYKGDDEVKKDTDWDISKHGLAAYLTGQGYNAKGFFEGYDKRNPDDPDAVRSFKGRHGELRKHLSGYKDWLSKKNFDFTKNDNEWDDNFMATLDGLINNADWSDSNALSASLRKLGAGDAYTTAFTSDRWDLSKSDEDLASDAKKKAAEKKAKEEKEKYAAFAREKYDAYSNLSDNNLGGTYFTSKGDGFFDMSDSEYEDWLNTHTKDADAYMNNLQARYYANPFDAKIAGEYLPLAARFGALKEVTIDGKTWTYDPRTIDRTNNRLVVFDKETGEMKHTFLGDISEEWNAIRKKWRQDNGYENAADKYTQYSEQGGVLSMQTGGGFNLAQAVNRDLENRNKVRAAETGNTEEVQKARDRVVSNGDDSFKSEKDSIGQPDAGFSGAEIARLASIGADITSMFLDPITGTVVGLGSTLTNFGADIADDGFQWEDVKNLGINVGFDLLGAIPIFGDAFGTGAKITKNLIKFAPRAMAIFAGYQGVANMGGIMDSWGKLTSGDKDQKLTVQDWRNIAQSISLLTGGVRATKNKVAQSKMKQQARLDDVIGVNVRNKATGELEQVIVDGDTAKNIRAAKGDKAKIEAELSKLDDFKDKFGDAGTLEINTRSGGLQSPVGRHEVDGGTRKEWGWDGFRKEGLADVNDVYDFSRVPKGYGQSAGIKIPGVSDRLNAWHQNLMSKTNAKLNPTVVDQRGKMSSDAFEAEQVRLLNDQGVEAQIGKVKEAVAARKKYLEDIQGRITTTEGEITAARQKAGGDDLVAQQADAEARLRGLASNDAINDAHNTVSHHTATIARNKAKRAALSKSRAEQIAQVEAKVTQMKTRITEIDGLISTGKQRLKEIDLELSGRVSKARRAELEAEKAAIPKTEATLKKERRALNRALPGEEAAMMANRDRIVKNFQRAYTQLAASTRTSKGAIATAQPIAAQRKAYSEAYAQQQAAISGQALQKRLNTLQGRKASHDPATAHTHAYKELETMLNNLRTTSPTIGGKTVNWDMDAILQRYGVNSADVFKQGGSINRNKINKFLNYAKG